MLQFVSLIFWKFSFGNDIVDFLPEFSANIFFLPYHVCKQFILSFQTLQTIFFSIFLMHTPSRKIMVRVTFDVGVSPSQTRESLQRSSMPSIHTPDPGILN